MPFNPILYPAAFLEPISVSSTSAWKQHIPFAFTLMECLRPARFVELGVHAGDSYCAFCQAREHLNIATECFGVDTWKGDPQVGFYPTAVLADLKSHHDPRYAAFSKLLEMTFDQALPQFEDGSIDLLHIDGLHTYEAVRHDFETWLPKMSNRGIVLFHDTAVRQADVGVHRLWDELTPKHPHFQFEHGMGLGVLGVGTEIPEGILPLFQSTPAEAASIRNCYFRLGRDISVRSYYAGVMRGIFHGQSLINQWKQQTGQTINPQSQNLQLAIGNPGFFVQNLVAEIQAMASSELNRRK